MSQTNIIIFEEQSTLYTTFVLWRESWFGLVTFFDTYDGDRIVGSDWCWSSRFWATIKEQFSGKSIFGKPYNYNVISRDYERGREFFPKLSAGTEWMLILEPPCFRKANTKHRHFACEMDHWEHPTRKWNPLPIAITEEQDKIQESLLKSLGDSKISKDELLNRFMNEDKEITRLIELRRVRKVRANIVLNEMLRDGTLKKNGGSIKLGAGKNIET
mgnify:CR=1 FL=1|jgi:hypothetical protein